MNKWKPLERFSRMLLILLGMPILSLLLPNSASDHLKPIVSWVDIWGIYVVVSAAACALYAVLAWAPKWDWDRISIAVSRLVFGVTLILGLTMKLWYQSAQQGWGVVWFWCAVTAIVRLSGYGMIKPEANGKYSPPELGDLPRLLLDTPLEETDDDEFNRRPLAEVLAAHITKYTEAQPLTIALDGGWGTGKTSVMRLMQGALTKQGYKTRWVNAWVYDNKAGIWRAVVRAIIELLEEYRIPVAPYTAMRRYYRIAGEVIKSSGASPSKALAGLLENLPTNDDLIEVKQQVGTLVSDLVGETKLVIFIDDLDRCSPESTLGTLEFLKEITDFRNCIFVIGMDTSSVVSALKSRYEDRSREFLNKVINVTVNLNDVARHRLVEYFTPQLVEITGYHSHRAARQAEFLLRSLDDNPRSVKQVLNSVVIARSLLDHLFDLRSEDYLEALLSAQILRFKYPKVCKRLSDETLFKKLDTDRIVFQARQKGGSSAKEDNDKAWREHVGEILDLNQKDVPDVLALLERGGLISGFISISSIPRSVMFSYLDPPDWLPESKIMGMVRQLQEKVLSIDEAFSQLSGAGPLKASEFATRCVNLLVQLHRDRGRSYTSERYEFSASDLKSIILDIVDYQARTSPSSVVPLDALKELLLTEFRTSPRQEAEGFARSVLRPDSWTADTLWAWAQSRERLVEPAIPEAMVKLMDEIELCAGRRLLRDTLHLLGGPIAFGDDGGIIACVANLQSDLLADSTVQVTIIEVASSHADDQDWIQGFRYLVHQWLRWADIGGDVSSEHGRWVAAADAGLLTTIADAVNALHLTDHASRLFARDLEQLHAMTEAFRSDTGDWYGEEDDGKGQSEGEPS